MEIVTGQRLLHRSWSIEALIAAPLGALSGVLLAVSHTPGILVGGAVVAAAGVAAAVPILFERVAPVPSPQQQLVAAAERALARIRIAAHSTADGAFRSRALEVVDAAVRGATAIRQQALRVTSLDASLATIDGVRVRSAVDGMELRLGLPTDEAVRANLERSLGLARDQLGVADQLAVDRDRLLTGMGASVAALENIGTRLGSLSLLSKGGPAPAELDTVVEDLATLARAFDELGDAGEAAAAGRIKSG